MSPLPRIDKAVIPAGWIKSAACFSLFVHPQALVAVKTGFGWNVGFAPFTGSLGAGLGRLAGQAVIASAQRKAGEVEQQLDPSRLEAEVQARAGSFFVSWESITARSMQISPRVVEVSLEAAGEKRRFHFERERIVEVEAFLGAWPRRAP